MKRSLRYEKLRVSKRQRTVKDITSAPKPGGLLIQLILIRGYDYGSPNPCMLTVLQEMLCFQIMNLRAKHNQLKAAKHPLSSTL